MKTDGEQIERDLRGMGKLKKYVFVTLLYCDNISLSYLCCLEYLVCVGLNVTLRVCVRVC